MSRIKKKQRGLLTQKNIKKEPGGAKWPIQGLVFSVALNVALITSFVFNAVKEKKSVAKYAYETCQGAISVTQGDGLESFLADCNQKNQAQLIELFHSKRPVEEGFTERDIAVSVLRNRDDLDLVRALVGQEFSERQILIADDNSTNISYPIVSGLTNHQYKLVENFIANEAWPQTGFGLYKKLVEGQKESSLKNAFYLTPEFMTLYAYFHPQKVSKEEVLEMVLQGPWELSARWVQPEGMEGAARFDLLCDYLDHQSLMAVELILRLEHDNALKKMSDAQVISWINFQQEMSKESEDFILQLAMSNRSDDVRERASRKLLESLQVSISEPFNYLESLDYISLKFQGSSEPQCFEPEKVSVQTNDLKTYTIQSGDNLWKIAKRHDVKLEELKKANHLESDLIKVGRTLIIP